MRICELGDGDGGLVWQQEQQEGVQEASGGRELVRLKVKRALVGAGARVLFYPTLLYNILRNRFEADFWWWDHVDQFILLGAVPFPSDVPQLKQLGVQGVVTLNEPYETLVPTSLYQANEIEHLVIPTRDYLFAPSVEDISQAIDFIHLFCGGRYGYKEAAALSFIAQCIPNLWTKVLLDVIVYDIMHDNYVKLL
ncbi:phosphatidylglycerophosphate phosphatase PTPMT2-like [Miscanthus floridulus]|uniref:phosphatidylglycerophosphate phosphatase PTPMT2-like n=1 Tax=Miscanthus floridulus TaxID=154761 RepID=UPI003458CE96